MTTQQHNAGPFFISYFADDILLLAKEETHRLQTLPVQIKGIMQLFFFSPTWRPGHKLDQMFPVSNLSRF